MKQKINRPVVYISGKITGLPQNQVLSKFHDAEVEIMSRDCSAVNPCNIGSNKLSWFDNMQICLHTLKMCTHIYFLDNATDSPGAQVEAIYAEKLGLKEFKI